MHLRSDRQTGHTRAGARTESSVAVVIGLVIDIVIVFLLLFVQCQPNLLLDLTDYHRRKRNGKGNGGWEETGRS